MNSIAIFVKNLTSGGAEKQSVLLAKALTSNYKVHYIIFNGEKIHQKYMDMLKTDPRIVIKTFDGRLIKRFYFFREYIKSNKFKAIFSYLTAANAYACFAVSGNNTKVYTGLRNAKLPFLKEITDKFLTNNFAEQSIANCYSGKINFVKKGFNEKKITVIPNCFEDIRDYASKQSKDNIRIITVGRFVKQKDYETAIRSIADLKKYHNNIVFDIVGYGELESKIRKWIEFYYIKNITTIYINPDNIPELLDKADIYLSTSLFEGTSNSIMEAMNANLPIVATNVGDNKFLIKDNINGFLCKKKDYKQISMRLNELINNEELRIRQGKESKKNLQNNYSIDIFKKRYIDLIEE